MRVGGLQRLSLIDFPGKLAAIIFTVGCNFRCPFCHNSELVNGKIDLLSEDFVLQFLSSRTDRLEGVVISGGEPTMHNDLPEFIKKIRDLGFAIKLDTNGTNPDLLATLIDEGLLDFVAMDIKHIWTRYPFATSMNSVSIEKIQRSAEILIGSAVGYEFRTTVIRDFHSPQDIIEMSEQIRGAKRYVVQEFIPKKTLDSNFAQKFPLEKKVLEGLIPEISKNVRDFEIRQ